MVKLTAPPNHGPTVVVDGHEVMVEDGHVEVTDHAHAEALLSHGFYPVGGEHAHVVGHGADVPIPYTTLVQVLKDLGVVNAESLPHASLVGTLVAAASHHTHAEAPVLVERWHEEAHPAVGETAMEAAGTERKDFNVP